MFKIKNKKSKILINFHCNINNLKIKNFNHYFNMDYFGQQQKNDKK